MALASMKHVPLLEIIGDFYALPRDPNIRFPAYRALIGNEKALTHPPLLHMNPMGREHINDYVQTLQKLDIDHAACRLVPIIAQALGYSGSHLHGIGIVDDVAGGWTCTADIEMKRRFSPHTKANGTWCSTVLLATEPPTVPSVTAEITAAIVRHHWQTQHGPPLRLRDMLAQEQAVSCFVKKETQDAEVHTYIRECITAYFDETAYPAIVSVLLGDHRAATLGYPGLGLGPNAGLHYAQHPDTPIIDAAVLFYADIASRRNDLRYVVPE
jgi:hypothetical protein